LQKDKNTETVIFQLLDRTGVILETPELFTKAHLTHKQTYAYLSLFISSWIMQEHWESDLFCFGDGRISGIFLLLLRFVQKQTDSPLFLLHPRTDFLMRIF